MPHSAPAGRRHQESRNEAGGNHPAGAAWEQALALRLRRFRHQREGARLPHVGIQLPPGVGNALRETLLVNRPQGFEIRGPEIGQVKFHAAHCSRRAGRAVTLSAGVCRNLQVFMFVLSSCPGREITLLALPLPPDVPFASEDSVDRWVLIEAMAAVLAAAVWYFGFARYNYRRGVRALRWVTACAAEGNIGQARWLGPSRLQANLRLATHWFERVRVTVRLLPRPMPSSSGCSVSSASRKRP